MFGAFFHAISGGWLAATFTLQSDAEILVVFRVFAVGYGSMAMIMAMLFGRAVRLAPSLAFSPIESMQAMHYRTNWRIVAGFCLVSFLLTLVMPVDRPIGFWLGLPGYVLFGLFAAQLMRWRLYRKKLRKLEDATAPAAPRESTAVSQP